MGWALGLFLTSWSGRDWKEQVDMVVTACPMSCTQYP